MASTSMLLSAASSSVCDSRSLPKEVVKKPLVSSHSRTAKTVFNLSKRLVSISIANTQSEKCAVDVQY